MTYYNTEGEEVSYPYIQLRDALMEYLEQFAEVEHLISRENIEKVMMISTEGMLEALAELDDD